MSLQVRKSLVAYTDDNRLPNGQASRHKLGAICRNSVVSVFSKFVRIHVRSYQYPNLGHYKILSGSCVRV